MGEGIGEEVGRGGSRKDGCDGGGGEGRRVKRGLGADRKKEIPERVAREGMGEGRREGQKNRKYQSELPYAHVSRYTCVWRQNIHSKCPIYSLRK